MLSHNVIVTGLKRYLSQLKQCQQPAVKVILSINKITQVKKLLKRQNLARTKEKYPQNSMLV